jgi:hypothetical protein
MQYLEISRALLLMGMLISAAVPLHASDCCDPASPFREGEGYAETPATCANLGHWAERAPTTNDRVSMSVQGKLSGVHSNGILAYLEMCDPKGLRVVCVTYETNGMQAGEVVTFGGGFARRNKEWVILDPCLASR